MTLTLVGVKADISQSSVSRSVSQSINQIHYERTNERTNERSHRTSLAFVRAGPSTLVGVKAGFTRFTRQHAGVSF